MNPAEKLFRFKDQNERAGTKINRLEGELIQLLSSLKKKYVVNTINRAEGLLKKKRDLREKKIKKFDVDVEVLEAEYDWD